MVLTELPTHMTQADVQALLDARHPEPFKVLGSHGTGPVWIVALVPDATKVAAIVDGTDVPLSRINGPLFGGPVSGHETGYRLRADFDGAIWEFDDPYRFGPVLGDLDKHLIAEGSHRKLWCALGAHVLTHEGTDGTHFAVWAPNARRVSVIGDFNSWDGRRNPMRRVGDTGAWELFMPGLGAGTLYKYEIASQCGEILEKADPVGFGAQHPPATASVVRDLSGYRWHDQDWMDRRAACNRHDAPVSIYEVHLGSWRRNPQDGNRPLSYRELATELVAYAVEMGFTHLEFMPVSEFPFDGSWGYQPVGMYAPTIRFGTPEEFRALVEAAHQAGLGVILDWVPGHFPSDAHGLAQFDGTHLYEHSDPREGFHQDWNTLIYNYGRTEVRNFLTANALYWLQEYHLDGLRVDAVASMLYRDYSRKHGEWIPNRDGGRENYEAIDFLKEMNSLAYAGAAGIMTVAEESTAFPRVSSPVSAGGLGFGFKWNMGWMNDSLRYIELDPIHRRYDHHLITFPIDWAFTENFMLPISHDEVVHGKGSMLTKMPGTEWEKFANLRAYYGYMWAFPGKKLLFMGCEFAQWAEWNHDQSLDWDALKGENHRGIQAWVRDLNHLYRETPALYRADCDPTGFAWVTNRPEESISAFLRRCQNAPQVLAICHFTPVPRDNVRIGVPHGGAWHEVLNSDDQAYGGGNRVNGRVMAEAVPWDGQSHSIVVSLPPLATMIFTAAGQD